MALGICPTTSHIKKNHLDLLYIKLNFYKYFEILLEIFDFVSKICKNKKIKSFYVVWKVIGNVVVALGTGIFAVWLVVHV